MVYSLSYLGLTDTTGRKILTRRNVLIAGGLAATGAAAHYLTRPSKYEGPLSDPFMKVIDRTTDVARWRDGGYWRPFSDAEYNQRLQGTRERMAKDGIDLLYVTSPDSFCYYTGYQATWYRAQSTTRLPAQAALVIHVDHDDFIFFETLDEYLVHQATATLENRHWLPCEIAESAEVGANYIVGELQKLGWAKGRVGMELWSHVPSPAISNLIQAAFENAGATVVDGTLTIRGVRKKKSPQELAYIEEAARIVDIGHKAVADSVRPSITQAELQGNALQAMLAAGEELLGTN